MADLNVGVKVSVDNQGAVQGLKPVTTEIEKIKTAAGSTTGPLNTLGGAGETAARKLRLVGSASDEGARGARLLGAESLSARGALSGLSSAAQGAVSSITGVAGAGESAGLALGAVGTGALVAVGAVAALAIGFGVAVSQADAFNAKVEGVAQAIARAGQSSQVTAEQILSDNAKIAGSSGQAFDDVNAAALGLIKTHDYSRETINQLTNAGANMAATFGGDVTSSTNEVAKAFDALGNGDAKALETGFDFLSEATRGSIKQLIELGLNAEAQQGFLAALSATTHGGAGSASSAFGALTSATGDLIGSWLASLPAIQTVQGWMRDLARTANETAAAIRSAAYATLTGGAAETRSKLLKISVANSRLAPGQKSGTEVYEARLRAQLKVQARDERDQLERDASSSVGGAAGLSAFFAKGRQNAGITVTGARKAPRATGGGTRAKAIGDGLADAKREARELTAAMAELERSFDPIEAAWARYEITLAKIAQVEKAGIISKAKAEDYRHQAALNNIEEESRARAAALAKNSPEVSKVATTSLDIPIDQLVLPYYLDIEERLTPIFKKAGKAGGDALRDSGLDAAQAISQILSGKIGGIAEKLIGLIKGTQTGDFSGVGGKVGGALTLISQQGSQNGDGFKDAFLVGIRSFGNDLKTLLKSLEKAFTDIFGKLGSFGKQLGETLGTAFAGAQFGKAATDAVGVKGSNVGGAIGAIGGQAIGAAIGGPAGAAIGKVLGSVVGSVIGGLFTKVKTGTTRITSVEGKAETSGSFGAQLSGTASSVQSGINAIIEQLGGSAGSFGVSIGKRGDYFRVSGDANANVSAKHPGAVLYDGKDEAAATSAAILNALHDGAVTGLSERVSAALKSSTDLNQALAEAVKVQGLEDLLAGFGGNARKVFVDFERQARDRLRTASKYGFDLVKLEAENSKQRAAILAESISTATGGLKQLLEQLTSGDKSAGTLSDRRASLIAQADVLRPQAASDAAAATKLADVLDQLYQVSLDANGSAGAQFAGDRNTIRSTAETIIAQATAEIGAAQDKARTIAGTDASSTNALISQSNGALSNIASQANETNDKLAQLVAIARQGQGSSSPASVSNYGAGFQIAREVAR